ncbi:polycystin family receptor for egg jelly-like [Lytechinus pictus]|uniref:polycystin family receptor for egg jelly-like n=1 Tax=Lytechinus pictus TaxID=7653 RepID=UPI0030BA1E96
MNQSYAVLKSGNACFCLNSSVDELGSSYDTSSCDQSCDSSPSQSCGGERLVSVYDVNDVPLTLDDVQIEELQSQNDFPAFEPVTFTLTNPATWNQTDDQTVTIDISFDDEYPFHYEGPWQEGMTLQHIFREPGPHAIHLRLVQVGPGSDWILPVSVHIPVSDIAISCPIRNPGMQSYDCDITVAMGTSMQLSAFFQEDSVLDSFNVSDSQIEYVGVDHVAPGDSAVKRSQFTSLSATQSFGEVLKPLPMDERYIKAKDPVLKDGLLVGIDLDVEVSGYVSLEVFRPLADESSTKCENNTKPAEAVLPVSTSYSCQNQGGFSFTKRRCINPTPDTVPPTLLTTYQLVASIDVTLPIVGRYFVPLNELDRVKVRRGDILALVSKTAVVVRRSTTVDQELALDNGRLTGEGVLEYDGVTSVPGEHQWRALVVLPSRIWVRNTNVGMWDTSLVNVTFTNPVGEKFKSVLAPTQYPGIEIVTPPYGLVGDEILVEAIFETQLDKFTWNFGDGEEVLMNLCNMVHHTWSEPGLYNVTVEGNTVHGSVILTTTFLVTHNPPLPNITLNETGSAQEVEDGVLKVSGDMSLSWYVYYEAPNVSYEVVLGNSSEVSLMVWEGSPEDSVASASIGTCDLADIMLKHENWGATLSLFSSSSCILPLFIVSQNAFGNDTQSLDLHILEAITERPIINITANFTETGDDKFVAHDEEVIVDIEIVNGHGIIVDIFLNDTNITSTCISWDVVDRRASCVIDMVDLESGYYNLKVEVSNEFSPVFNSSVNFTIQMRITNLRVQVDNLIETEVDTPICLFADQGSSVTYVIQISDGTNLTGTTNRLPTNSSCQTEVHRFMIPGNIALVVTAQNEVSQENVVEEVVVMAPVYTLIINVQEQVNLNVSQMGYAVVTIGYTGSPALQPVEVKLNVTLINSADNSVHNLEFEVTEGSSYPVSFQLPFFSSGIFVYEYFLFNNVSLVTSTGEITAGSRIQNATFNVVSLTVWSGEIVNFTVSLVAGTNVTYMIDFGDGSVIQSSNVTSSLEMVFSHTFSACWTEDFDVVLEVKNYISMAEDTITLTVIPSKFSVVNEGPFAISAPPHHIVQVPFFLFHAKNFSVPDDVVYIADFDDGVGERALDITFENSPSLDTSTSTHLATVSKSFTSPGAFIATFLFNTSQFFQECEIPVDVYEEVSNPRVHVFFNYGDVTDKSMDENAFGTDIDHIPLDASVVVEALTTGGTTLLYEWSFGTRDDSALFEIQPSYWRGDSHRNAWKFRSPGSYMVSVNISNAVSWEVSSLTVAAQSKVSGLSIEGPGIEVGNKSLMFTLHFSSLPTEACIFVDFEDQSSKPSYLAVAGDSSCATMDSRLVNTLDDRPLQVLDLTQMWNDGTTSIDVFNEFGTTGVFSIKVLVQNIVSQTRTSTEQVIRSQGCYPPVITFGHTGELSILVSQRLGVKTTISLNCTSSNLVYYMWQVYYILDNGTLEEVALPSSIDSEGATQSKIVFPARTFSPGNHVISVTVSIQDEPGLATVATANASIAASDLVAMIIGGDKRIVSYQVGESMSYQDLFVDGSSSFDPDKESQDHSGWTFTWLCRRKSYTYANGTIIEDLETFQVWNQDFSMLLSDSVVNADFEKEAFDVGGCFGLHGGPSNAPLPGGLLLEHSDVVAMDTRYVYPNMVYEMKLHVSDGFRNATALQTIYVKNGSVPDVSLECEANCQRKVNPQNKWVIRVIQSSTFVDEIIYYKWELSEYRSNVKHRISPDAWLPHSSLSNQTTTSSNYLLAIESGFFEEGGQYEIDLMASYSPSFSTTADMTMTLDIDMAPYGGSCSISPLEGTVAVTKFSFTCRDWMVVDDDCRPLRYAVRSKVRGVEETVSLSTQDTNNVWSLIYSDTESSSSDLLLAAGLSEYDYIVYIKVQISDIFGTYAVDSNMEIRVHPFNMTSSVDLAETLTDLTNAMVSEASTGYNQQSTSYAMVISDMLNTDASSGSSQPDGSSSNTGLNSEIKMGIRERMVTILGGSSSISVDDVDRISSVLSLATDVPSEVSTLAQDGALGATEKLTNTLVGIQEEDQTAIERLQLSASLLLKVCDNVVDAAIEKMDYSENDQDSVTVLRNSAVQNTLVRSVSVVDKVSEVLSNNVISGEGPVTMDAGNIRVKVQKTESKDVEGNFEVEPGCNLDFPSAQSMFDVDATSGGIQFKAVMYQPNMRPYAQGAAGINSKTVSFQFIDSSTKDVIEVKNTIKPITITIPRINQPTITLDNETVTSFSQTYGVGGPIAVHTIDIPDFNGVEFEVRCMGFTGMESNYTYNCTLIVMITTTGLPEIGSNAWNCTLVQTVSLSDYPLYNSSLVDPWNKSDFISVEGNTRCFIDNNQMNELLINGTYTSINVGVRELANEANWNETYARTPNATFEFKHYSFSPTLHSCSYIKERESESPWKKDGCQVSPSSNASHTSCLCNHLTMFGAGFQIPMNRIDLSQSAFTKLHENPVVFAFMTCCLCIYLVVLLWARKADKRDLLKAGVTPLIGNNHHDKCHYEVTVFTGVKSDAGTTARVHIIITGDHNDSGVRTLHDPKRKVLQSGGVDSFLLTSSRPFGDLMHVRIWHDNGGKSPSWFLSHLSVKDLNTNKMFYFMANRWWAVEEDDGAIDRVIPVAGRSELTSFTHLFSTKTRKNLSDGHLWFSVFSRPPKSRFTRVQRVSCCLSLLFSAMMANIFFYNVDFGSGGNQTVYSLGPISFSMGEVVIGVISSLMVFPANILVVQIFRLSRPQPKHARICCMKTKQPRVSSAGRRDVASRLSFASSMGSRELRQQLDLLERGQSTPPPPTVSAHVQRTNLTRVSSPSQVQLDPSEFQRSLSFDSSSLGSDRTSSPHLSRIPALTTEAGYKRMQSKPPMRKKKKFELPWQCLYFGWALLMTSVGVAFWLTIEVAGQFGKTKATEWLVSMCISLIQDVFFTQPLKVLFLAFFLSLLFKKPEKEEDDIPPLGEDEEWLHERDGEGGGETHQGIPPGISPPNPDELAAARELRFKEIKMKSIIREIILYIIFLNIVMLIAFGDRDPQAFYVNKSMKDAFVEAQYHGLMKFTKIQTREKFWNYTENVFIPSLFSETWYNGKEDIQGIKQRMVSGKHMMLIGMARLRQLRVTQEPCILPEEITSAGIQCKRTYSFSDDEDRDFAPGWKPVNESDPTDYTTPEGSVWKHNSWTEIDSFPYLGKQATYKGGGYLAEIPTNPTDAMARMQYLRESFWLDQSTRGVFFEFVTYNPINNMYCISFLLVEFPSQGGAFPYVNFRTIRLDRYQGSFAYFVLAGEVAYVLYLLYFTYREIKLFIKKKKEYFKSFWNMLEVVTLVMAYCAITFYLYRLFIGRQLMEQYRTNPDSFLNFQYVSHWDLLYRYMTAMVVFIANVKFMKLFRFNRRLLILSLTLKNAGREILYYLIVFGIVFMAFSTMAFNMYSPYLLGFSTFGSTIVTLFSTMLGKFKFAEMVQTSRHLGPLFFFCYVIIIIFICLNMFLSIINEAFARVRQENSKMDNELEIVDFMMGRFKKFVGLTRQQNTKKKRKEEEEKEEKHCIEDDDPIEMGCKEMETKTQEMILRMETFLKYNLTPDDIKLTKRKIVFSE